jgi:acetyltransferase-like isoleucine patch superfamily enzyme
MSVWTQLAIEARKWGFGNASELRKIAPLRFRGLLLRWKIDRGGHLLLAREQAQIIKRPGGRQQLTIGDRAYLAERSRIVFEGGTGCIEFGDDVVLGDRSEIRARELIRIGSGSVIAFGAIVTDTNHHDIDGSLTTSPTVLGERVWIGAGAMVLRGVTIGDGAVVAAGSVITTDVPAGSLVAGNPARLVREHVTWHR